MTEKNIEERKICEVCGMKLLKDEHNNLYCPRCENDEEEDEDFEDEEEDEGW